MRAGLCDLVCAGIVFRAAALVVVWLAGSGIVVLWFRGWCGRVGRVAL